MTLKELIEEKYGTVSKYVDESEIPRTTMYRILKREFYPSTRHTLTFCRELNLSIEDFVRLLEAMNEIQLEQDK